MKFRLVLFGIFCIFLFTVPAYAQGGTQPQGQNIQFGDGTGVKIAIIDTGVDPFHPDLAGTNLHIVVLSGDVTRQLLEVPQPWQGSNKAFVDVENPHGTPITGIISREAPGAEIWLINPVPPLLVANDGGEFSLGYEYVRIALEWILQQGDFDVINMSFGFNAEEQQIAQQTLDPLLAQLAAQNVLIVKSLARPDTAPSYPAYSPYVLTVSVVGPNKQVPQWIVRNPGIDFVAPAINIPAPYPNNYTTMFGSIMEMPPADIVRYTIATGASFAAAHASGAAARVKSTAISTTPCDLDQNGVWSNADTKECLRITSVDIYEPGRDNASGWGIIRPYKNPWDGLIPSDPIFSR
jgi:subtilisin family serine protease